MSAQKISLPLAYLLLLTTISACASVKIAQHTCVPVAVEPRQGVPVVVEPGQVALTIRNNFSYTHTYTYIGPTSDGRHLFRMDDLHSGWSGSSNHVLLPEVPIRDAEYGVRIVFIESSTDRLTYVIQQPTNPGGWPTNWCELSQV